MIRTLGHTWAQRIRGCAYIDSCSNGSLSSATAERTYFWLPSFSSPDLQGVGGQSEWSLRCETQSGKEDVRRVTERLEVLK